MDLNELASITEKEVADRTPIRIRCCQSSGCLSAQGKDVFAALKHAVSESSLEDKIQLCSVGCMGLCSQGPMVGTEPDGTIFVNVTPSNAPEVIAFLEDKKCSIPAMDESQPFFASQHKIVLENCGKIDPERIEDYIASGGYRALHTAVTEYSPAEVVQIISDSGLRGRGGAGYPTGLKWATVAKNQAGQKYIVCNGDEGDPGAFMDRSVLEGDPHRVLEGMAIAAYAVGANQGYLYIRGEYPLAISRMQTAIKRARFHGLLGSQIFDTSFDFRVDIRIGAGAFVCGEETALIASIEGKRGIPRPRPPYPAVSGLWGNPTLINNVETFANIASIVKNGAEWYSNIGTVSSKGTKVFALSGKCANSGLIEVPMGTSLRTIVEEMGGGIPDGGKVKAVQTGGPSGGCIPADLLDTPVDYESLTKLGSIMGSGGLIVMDQNDSMVEIARYFLGFCMDESCGKCVPCRVGTVQMYKLLGRIADGQGTEADIGKLRRLCDVVRNMSLCGLGQAAPNPVLSTLRYFESEYLALVTDHHPQPINTVEVSGVVLNGTAKQGKLEEVSHGR